MRRASGESGELRVGYQHAARLGAWSLVLLPKLPRCYVVRTRVLSEHSYWARQRPIDLVLDLAGVEWIWRDVAITRDGDDVVVEVADAPIVEKRRVSAAKGV